MSNNNDDNISTILMIIGLFTVLYWLLKFFQTDFGENLFLFIILIPPFIFFVRNFFCEKEIPLLERWPYLFMASLFGALIYIIFFG